VTGTSSSLPPSTTSPARTSWTPSALYPRAALPISDSVTEAPPEDPTAPIRGHSVFLNRSVYADVDRRFTSDLAPLLGSVVAVDLYDDSQVFQVAPDFPLIRKQMPRFLGSPRRL
jgi:hypothetical protein